MPGMNSIQLLHNCTSGICIFIEIVIEGLQISLLLSRVVTSWLAALVSSSSTRSALVHAVERNQIGCLTIVRAYFLVHYWAV